MSSVLSSTFPFTIRGDFGRGWIDLALRPGSSISTKWVSVDHYQLFKALSEKILLQMLKMKHFWSHLTSGGWLIADKEGGNIWNITICQQVVVFSPVEFSTYFRVFMETVQTDYSDHLKMAFDIIRKEVPELRMFNQKKLICYNF